MNIKEISLFHFTFQKKHELHVLQNSEMLVDFGIFSL